MDEKLKKELERKLLSLERSIDCWGDTPKRRRASELVRDIRLLMEQPVTKGYEA